MLKANIYHVALLLVSILIVVPAEAQIDNLHRQSTIYEWPKDPAVKEKLDDWQDLKFGMIIHWGLYAVPGMVESWALCSEDWISGARPEDKSYGEFKDWYWGLSKAFNPTQFDPHQWAQAADNAGMKYLVFTTKHHDGFCMFDSDQTDFTIANGPFKSNPKADVAKYVFEAFREHDFMIGAYFSKPDWHNNDFWWKTRATPDRNANYDIRKYPEKWKAYNEFTEGQIDELMTNYGNIDILWLDGGWVRPPETVTEEVIAWGAPIPEFRQELNMAKIAKNARSKQEGLLVVDRTVHGEFENYQTPEQRIPKERIANPWESCMTLGNAWGWVNNDKLKSPERVIHNLVEVVAKGGSLLLGVGPNAQGLLEDRVIEELNEIGKHVEFIGPAIYNTRSIENFKSGNTYFTKNKDQSINAIHLIAEDNQLLSEISWFGNLPADGAKIKLVGSDDKVKYNIEGDKVIVLIKKKTLDKLMGHPAIAFTYELKN